jgi:hypothetical protein
MKKSVGLSKPVGIEQRGARHWRSTSRLQQALESRITAESAKASEWEPGPKFRTAIEGKLMD